MTNFARIVGNVAVDVSTDPAQQFHPDLVSQFVPVPDEVQAGWRLNGEAWEAPSAPEPAPAPEPVQTYPTVGPIHFKMLFTAAERLKAKELCASDPMLDDFWELIEDPRTDVVNLSLQSVQAAVQCTLEAVKAAGVEVDVPVRKAAILTGVLQ